jgi:hypothetical protein
VHCTALNCTALRPQLSLVVVGWLQLGLSCLGIIGNSLSILLLSSPVLRSPFNQLLRLLACFDLVPAAARPSPAQVYLVTMVLEAVRKLGLGTDIHLIIFPQVIFSQLSIQ